MARRLQYTVVGLPHYTIWHLYEPSVDDIKHMEEMDKEKKAKVAKERADRDKIAKINTQFDNPSSDWEKDKAQLAVMAEKAAELARAKLAEFKQREAQKPPEPEMALHLKLPVPESEVKAEPAKPAIEKAKAEQAAKIEAEARAQAKAKEA